MSNDENKIPEKGNFQDNHKSKKGNIWSIMIWLFLGLTFILIFVVYKNQSTNDD
jgi:cytoskeletal protein RodZ